MDREAIQKKKKKEKKKRKKKKGFCIVASATSIGLNQISHFYPQFSTKDHQWDFFILWYREQSSDRRSTNDEQDYRLSPAATQ